MMLASALVSGAVDAFVTPQAISAMVRTARSPEPKERTPPGRPGRADDDGEVRQSWAYRGPNSFAVKLTGDDRPEETLTLLMERRGLFAWRLAAIDLPETPPA